MNRCPVSQKIFTVSLVAYSLSGLTKSSMRPMSGYVSVARLRVERKAQLMHWSSSVMSLGR